VRGLDALGAQVLRETSPAVQEVASDAVMRRWHGGSPSNGEVHALPRDAFASLGLIADLLDKRFVSDAHFAMTLQALGEPGLVNLIVLLGHSNMRCAQQALAGSRCAL
jgi:hypothetical protein